MVKEIKLTKGKTTLVDDDDFEYLSQWQWYVNSGYAARQMYVGAGKQHQILMHRVIANTPEGMFTDHINGNKLDNRKCNLRVVTRSQNCRNQGPRIQKISSQHKGVYWHKRDRRWRATITTDERRIWLGDFKTELEAANAYKEAARKYHGEFARTESFNQPNEVNNG